MGRDAAVMGGGRQQEDGAQDAASTWNGAETEQDHDPLLERAPSAQKTHRSLVVLHRYWRRLCTQDFTTTAIALNYEMQLRQPDDKNLNLFMKITLKIQLLHHTNNITKC